MSRHRFGARHAVRCAAFVALILAASAVGQDPGRDSKVKAKPTAEGGPGGANDTTLYLVLRCGQALTEPQILNTLQYGIKMSDAVGAGAPTIKPVSKAFFEEFAALVDRSADEADSVTKGGMTVKLLPSKKTVYELEMKPTQVVKKLTVNYPKAGAKEYTPAAPGSDSPFVLTVPGRYAYTPEVGELPKDYEVAVSELGEKDATLKGEWPKGDKFFVVTVKNFNGDKKKLFAAIADGENVANPVDSVQIGSDLLFAFADMDSQAGKTSGGFDFENRLTLVAEKIAKRNPKRVWAYFPLDKAAMEAAAKKYAPLDGLALPAEIRKDAIMAEKDAAINTDDKPQWYELTDTKAAPPAPGFARKVKLNDLPGFMAKYPTMHMLLVWEFDNGTPEAIKVENATGEQVFVVDREETRWNPSIKAAVKRDEKKAKDKGPMPEKK